MFMAKQNIVESLSLTLGYRPVQLDSIYFAPAPRLAHTKLN